MKNAENNSPSALYQTALLQSLMLGDYYGSVSVEELRKYGDTGIGTFDNLNGELIMLEGKVYSGLSDGSLREMPDDMTVPFCDVTFFNEDFSSEISSLSSMDDLIEKADAAITPKGRNYFYMVKISDFFTHIEYRSVREQKEPFRPLLDVMKTDQVLFERNNLKGTIVGLYCPDYMKGLNASGWHFHFVSSDLTTGGHLLNVRSNQVNIRFNKKTSFSMLLPENDVFSGLDPASDLEQAIKQVERNQ